MESRSDLEPATNGRFFLTNLTSYLAWKAYSPTLFTTWHQELCACKIRGSTEWPRLKKGSSLWLKPDGNFMFQPVPVSTRRTYDAYRPMDTSGNGIQFIFEEIKHHLLSLHARVCNLTSVNPSSMTEFYQSNNGSWRCSGSISTHKEREQDPG